MPPETETVMSAVYAIHDVLLRKDARDENMTATPHGGLQLINVFVLMSKMCEIDDRELQPAWSIAAISHIPIYITSDCPASARQAYPHHGEPDRKAEQDLGSDVSVTSLATSRNHHLEHDPGSEKYEPLPCFASYGFLCCPDQHFKGYGISIICDTLSIMLLRLDVLSSCSGRGDGRTKLLLVTLVGR